MTFLLISQNDIFSKVITSSITEIEKNAKIHTSDFSLSKIRKTIKQFEKLSLILIFKEDNVNITSEELSTLSSITGFAVAKDILVLTNIKELYNI